MSGPAVPRPLLPVPITAGRVIAVSRGLPTGPAAAVASALVEAGITAMEVTLDSPDALATVAALREEHGDGLAIGAGTVLDLAGARDAVAAGASYLVAPVTDVEVVRWAAERRVPAVPGATTPTEAWTAWAAGAAGVKLFPAGVLGPGYLAALAGPLGHIPFLPTGGIDARNAGAFLAAGAVAVGVGGWLVGDGDPDHVSPRARALVETIARDVAGAGDGKVDP